MKNRRQLGRIVGGVMALLASTSAQAGARAFMPTGMTVAPPPGYTDLCERGEVSCDGFQLAAASSSSALTTSSIGGGAMAPLEAATVKSAAKSEAPFLISFTALQAYHPGVDIDFVAAGAWPEAAPEIPAPPPPAVATAPREAASALAASTQMRLVNTINREVNRDVRKATDYELYGLLEYWSLPRVIDGRMYGDCEDYALEKRRRLVAAGVPASALSMAVAVTARGEVHAVLIVRFQSGDWVLDNLTPWATPWEELNYSWVQRQVDGSATWTTVG
jgi:predicted transglutaminase-like cysteine proteinase